MPSLQEAYTVRKEWRIAADEREMALRKRHIKNIETYNEHSKDLVDLNARDVVAVQNQNGNHPKRWDRTGKIIEKLPFRQYKVKMDGSGRVTLRNRRFLRKIDPVCVEPSIPKLTNSTAQAEDIDHQASINDQRNNETAESANRPTHQPSGNNEIPEVAIENTRKGTRNRIPREIFEAQHHGKSHSYKNVDTT